MPPSAAEVMRLQRSVGNAAVARLMAGRHEEDESAVQRSTVEGVLRSSGERLDESTRQDMEARLGADFSRVRVHTDAAARESAAELGARAYTSGHHIVVGAGGLDQHTLAHELTHVVQQASGPVAGTDRGDGVRVSDPSDRFEREAEATATRAMAQPAPDVHRVPVDDHHGHDHSVHDHSGHDHGGTSLQFARKHTTGPTERDPDSDNYDSDNDNFDTRFQPTLPQPTSESTVESLVAEGSDQLVTLWRGTQLPRAQSMVSAGSAGGVAADPQTAAPGAAAAQQQIGRGTGMAEFTTDTGRAEGFSHNSALVVVKIAAKYLARGSRTESGWIALDSAPLEVLDLVDRTRGQAPTRTANAS